MSDKQEERIEIDRQSHPKEKLYTLGQQAQSKPSSETQGQSGGSGDKSARKFSSTGKGAPGYRLSPNCFQKFKQMPAPDWAQKMLCIIVSNRRTVSPESFS